jgi:hypothetical protein
LKVKKLNIFKHFLMESLKLIATGTLELELKVKKLNIFKHFHVFLS